MRTKSVKSLKATHFKEWKILKRENKFKRVSLLFKYFKVLTKATTKSKLKRAMMLPKIYGFKMGKQREIVTKAFKAF